MSQTLQNTKLAGAVTGMALLCCLLLAEPLPHGHGTESGPVAFPGPALVVDDLRRDLAYGMDQRARRFESSMAGAGPAGEALAIASVAVAASVVETTLSALLDDLGNHQVAAPAARAEDTARPDRAIRNRSAMAMPYFSTASGMARAHGE